MKSEIQIDNVRFTASTVKQAKTGLLGWISCTLNQKLRLDGLTLRRTRKGRFAVSFPAHLDKSGRKRFFLRPMEEEVRLDIERQIFQSLGIRGKQS